MSRTFVPSCSSTGHCLHQSTSADMFYCCRCGYIDNQNVEKRLNFNDTNTKLESWYCDIKEQTG